MTANIDHPVIIGVADFKNASKEVRNDGSDEPKALMLAAIREAIKDSGIQDEHSFLQNVDSISCVRAWSWHYDDLAAQISKDLGCASVAHNVVSPHNGSQPAKLLDEACQRIAAGTSKCAVLVGGDALDSLERYMAQGEFPPPGWTPCEQDVLMANMPKAFIDEDHGLGQPVQIYAMYENAFRARLQQTFSQNHDESASMYAAFSAIASRHPASWSAGKGAMDKHMIGTVSERNRMINTPYPMLMCAFNKVNVAAACIVTSESLARQLGVPKDKMVYVKGGAGTCESEQFYYRPTFNKSHAIQHSLDAALRVAGVQDAHNQVALFDFYSCFPIVPKLAIEHLRLPQAQQVSLLGGLTSFGGAGNNYSMHAIAEMTRQLRNDGKRAGSELNGLVLANGGVLSYQHVVILSNRPRQTAYPTKHALPQYCEQLPKDDFVHNISSIKTQSPNSSAIIETYTVDFGRKGDARKGHIVARLTNSGKRIIANDADEATLHQLANTQGAEVVGRTGHVFRQEDRNVFTFTTTQEKL